MDSSDFNIEEALSDISVDTECPSCNGKIDVTIKQIKNHETIICPHCQISIDLDTTES